MASIDYGAIVRKNDKIINKGESQFQNMKELIEVEYSDFNNKYFVYAGDKDFLLCFKKGYFTIVINGVEEKTHRQKFQWEKVFTSIGVDIEVEFLDKNLYEVTYGDVKSRNYRFKAKWKYKNDVYEVIYGYGIDTRLTKEIMDDYGFSDIEKLLMEDWFDFGKN